MIEHDRHLTVGVAIDKAIQVADVHVPPRIKEKMMVVLVKIMLGGFPTKIEA